MTPKYFKTLGKSVFAALILAAGIGTANAAVEDYTYYTITGDVLFDGGSIWGLTSGDTIEADVSIFGDATSDGTYSVDTIFIDFGGGLTLNESDFAATGGVSLTLSGGEVADFAFFNVPFTFESNFTQFTDGVGGNLVGTWSQIQQNAVPVPAAVWLFGSALLGMVGWARRKQAA